MDSPFWHQLLARGPGQGCVECSASEGLRAKGPGPSIFIFFWPGRGVVESFQHFSTKTEGYVAGAIGRE